MPNTTAWAASSQALLVMRTATRTRAVSAAAKRCPLGSTFMAGSPPSSRALHATEPLLMSAAPGTPVRQEERARRSRGWRRPGALVRQCDPGTARATQGRRDPAVVDLAPDREDDRSRQPPWREARWPAG